VPNKLYYGDNLDVLRRHVDTESVDLVYLDPPFKSDQDYNVLFKEHDGTKAAAQILAFEDTWEWNTEAERQFQEVVEGGDKLSEVMRAFRTFLGTSDMMAYLSMMAPRLKELRRVLKRNGSLYLHCDPTASHHLKLLLDAVFGAECFRSEIVWKRSTTHNDAKRWSPISDTIFYYAKGTPTWNPPLVPHSDAYIADKYRNGDGDGRRYTLDNMTSPKPRPNMMYEWKGFSSPPCGWRYSRETMAALDAQGRIWYPDNKSKRPRLKRYLDEMSGVLMGNVWTDISPLNSQARERLGYPTQKPQALLERIIEASSNEGDVICDPFCGCGTAIEATEHLRGRNWIGIDITHLSIALIKHRLQNAFGEGIKHSYEVIGEPVTLSDAEVLAREDPYQFQYWALGLVGARPTEQKKGADKGIDGRLFFFDDETGISKQVIFSVKAGNHVSPAFVRDLRGVIQRERAQIGVLIAMARPTREMLREAASAGFYQTAWGKHPRLQVLTIEQLLTGKEVDRPPTKEVDVTLRKRVASAVKPAQQLALPS
jgi:DNA modification methylase